MSRFAFVLHSLSMLVMGAIILLNVALRDWSMVVAGSAISALLIAVELPRRA